jgi:hypothetical protein
MERRSHVLINAAESNVADGAVFQGRDMSGGTRDWTVRLRCCRGGRSNGVEVVEIDNGRIAIDVLPTRGMGIWRVRRGSQTLGWRSPARGPVHPSCVPILAPSGAGWLEGFDELMCRCGLQTNGPPVFDDAGRLIHPLHGRIANLPAHYVELIVDEVARTLTIRGIVDEAWLYSQSLRLTTSLTTGFGSNELSWNDEVENIGGQPATLQLLYHFNLGQPLLQAGARITAPVRSVAPFTEAAVRDGIDRWNIIPPQRPESSSQVYYCELLPDELGQTRVLATGLVDNEAIALRFDTQALPCFTVWRNTAAEADGYVVGLEPGTNFPNLHPFEKQHGRAVSLGPGQKWAAKVTVAWHQEAAAIAAEEQAIRAMQGKVKANLSPNPRADWSPDA